MIAGIIDIEEKTIINSGQDSRINYQINWNVSVGDINNYDIVYPLLIHYTGDRLPFHDEIFEIIKDKVTLIKNIEEYKTEKYKIINCYGSPLTDFPFIPEKYIHYVSSLFITKISKPFCNKNNIYISRKKACLCQKSASEGVVRRTILNEDQLINAIEPFGFKTFYFEDLSIKEKIEIFSSANIILSPFGGALSFSFFANKDTKIIECLSNPKQPGFYEQFNHVCHVLKINYQRFSDLISDDQDNMVLNIPELIKIISSFA
jgi:hypothetical protein